VSTLRELIRTVIDLRLVVLIATVCAAVFGLVFLAKLKPREIKVFVTIFSTGMVAIAGMYVLTFFQPQLAMFYAYAVLAGATGILLFIYYRYFAG